LLVSLPNVAVFSTVYPGGPPDDDLHYDAFVPTAAVISEFNSIPAFAGIHTVLVVLLLLSFLLLLVVVSGHGIAVILAVACCWRYCCLHHCCSLHPN
jgi:hypothetical protein